MASPESASDPYPASEEGPALGAHVERIERLREHAQKARAEAETTEHEKPDFFRYLPAGCSAAFKDLLDFALIGSLPGIGTIVTACSDILTFLLLMFTKRNSSPFTIRWFLRRLLLSIAAFLFEAFLPGLNFLPMEVFMVMAVYLLDKHAQKA